MMTLTLRTARGALALVGVLFASLVSAQSYYIAFAGTPGSIACTTTTFSLGPGVTYSWNLPPGGLVDVVGTAGATIIASGVQSLGADSGTSPLVGGPMPYTLTPFPYTVKYLLTPQIPGAGPSGFSFDCLSAVGSNFQIIGAGNYGAIPTLSEWGLIALATLLAAASLVTLRRRRVRR